MSSHRFERLLDQWRGLGPPAVQELASLRLPALARASGLLFWRAGSDSRPRDALLLGVASWSRADLRLLDRIADSDALTDPPLVVFDLQDLPSQEALRAAFPELSELPSQPPFLAEIRHGAVVDIAWGADARARLARSAVDVDLSGVPEEASVPTSGPSPTVAASREAVVRIGRSLTAPTRSRRPSHASPARAGAVSSGDHQPATEGRRGPRSVA